LIDNDDDNINSIFLRVSNQSGLDFSFAEVRLSAPGLDESIEIEYSELNAGDRTDFKELPATPPQLENYSIHTYANHFNIGWLNSSLDSARTVDFTAGKFTYILEYTDRDMTDYEVVQDASDGDDNIRIRVENISDQNFVETFVYKRDDDPYKRGKVEFGSLASGEFSEYIPVDNALLYTEIRVITQNGEELDNTPLDHFSYDLTPGDYTYRVDIMTNNWHDISRLIRD